MEHLKLVNVPTFCGTEFDTMLSMKWQINRTTNGRRLTASGDEGGVEIFGEERVRQVAEELFEQSCDVVRIVFCRQQDFASRVKLLPQLFARNTSNTHTHTIYIAEALHGNPCQSYGESSAVVKLPSHRWGIPKFETTRYVCQTRGKVSNKHKAFHPTVH